MLRVERKHLVCLQRIFDSRLVAKTVESPWAPGPTIPKRSRLKHCTASIAKLSESDICCPLPKIAVRANTCGQCRLLAQQQRDLRTAMQGHMTITLLALIMTAMIIPIDSQTYF